MVSRCPSCGSPTPEDEKVCTSCGWDFVARKRTKLEPGRPADPAAPPAPGAPPAGSFALPPARNLNVPPVGEPTGLKALPKLEPRGTTGPAEGENPFTLPTARSLTPAGEPPKKAPIPEKPSPAPAAPAKEPAKEGLGARLFRSLRGESKPADAPATKPADVPDAPDAPERKGFSLPAARVVKADDAPVEKPREEKPRIIATPVDDVPVEILSLDEAPIEEPPPAPAPESAKPAPRPPRPETAEPKEEAFSAFPEPSARFEERGASKTPAPEPLLPTSARDVPSVPARPAPAAPPKPAPPAPEAAGAAESKKSMVMIAAVAGAALGTVSVLAVYLLMRPDTAPAGSATVESPFGRPGATPGRPAFPPAPGSMPPPVPVVAAPPAPAAAPSPAPQSPAPLLERTTPVPSPVPPRQLPGPIVAAPAPVPPPPAPAPAPAPVPAAVPAPDASRPAATFGSTPRLVVAGEAPKPAAQPAPRPAAPPEEPKVRKPKGPRWVFEGVVFDLLTARGVFGAKLIFVNPDGDVVGETDTGPAGRYKIALPAGSGYKLKISHGDYTERYIDEGDATSSLREATPEERRILMSAAARNLPWAGDAAKPVHRDLALVPKTPEEP